MKKLLLLLMLTGCAKTIVDTLNTKECDQALNEAKLQAQKNGCPSNYQESSNFCKSFINNAQKQCNTKE